MCINFIRKWRDLLFNVDAERHIFLRNFSWQFYLQSEFLPEICWEEVTREIFFSYFCFDFWPGVCTVALRLIGYCLTSIPNDRFLRNFFHGRFILVSKCLLEICWAEVAEEIFFLYFVFMPDLDYEPRLNV